MATLTSRESALLTVATVCDMLITTRTRNRRTHSLGLAIERPNFLCWALEMSTRGLVDFFSYHNLNNIGFMNVLSLSWSIRRVQKNRVEMMGA